MTLQIARVPSLVLARVGDWVVRPGCIFAEAPTRGGKTTTLVGLARALELAPPIAEGKTSHKFIEKGAVADVLYQSMDEAYAPSFGLSVLRDPTMNVGEKGLPPIQAFNDYITTFGKLVTEKSFVILDSVMTYMAVASALIEQPAMTGGYLTGYGVAAMRLNQLAAARNACVIAVTNKDAFPLQSFEFAVDGVMKIHAVGAFAVTARTNQRKTINVNFPAEVTKEGFRALGFDENLNTRTQSANLSHGL